MARKARVEGAAIEPTKIPDPVPGDNGDALRRIIAHFRVRFPAEWEALRLCPLQHGLDEIEAKLKG